MVDVFCSGLEEVKSASEVLVVDPGVVVSAEVEVVVTASVVVKVELGDPVSVVVDVLTASAAVVEDAAGSVLRVDKPGDEVVLDSDAEEVVVLALVPLEVVLEPWFPVPSCVV